ncbi:hypothetical protein T484DRAFT_1772130 [Baffinella frigidus]|nr:hypothetical protein T484DRAFT_1772130 [Cryptophyta sp. CCMP2293]
MKMVQISQEMVQISQEMVTRTQWMASVTETKKAKLEWMASVTKKANIEEDAKGKEVKRLTYELADAKGEEVKRLTYELDAMQKKVSSLEHDIKSERKAHDVHKKEMQEIKSLLACAGVQDPVPELDTINDELADPPAISHMDLFPIELDTINDELAGPPAISLMDLLPIVHAMRKQPQRSVNDVRRIIDIMNEEAAWTVEELAKSANDVRRIIDIMNVEAPWTVEELAKSKKAVRSGNLYDAKP